MKVSRKRNSSAQSMLQQLSIAEQIAGQQRVEGPQKSDVKPLETPVVAKGHPPIYRMHRFFARRPYNDGFLMCNARAALDKGQGKK